MYEINGSKNEFKIPNYKTESRLPKVLNKKEVREIINFIENQIHKLIIKLIYFRASKVSEIVNLQPKNFDVERMNLLLPEKKDNEKY